LRPADLVVVCFVITRIAINYNSSDYPPQQFGTLLGTISEINNAPTDSGFLAKAALPDGLQTNYGKQVFYRNGLMAQADIITQNMNLLERFCFNIKKSIQR